MTAERRPELPRESTDMPRTPSATPPEKQARAVAPWVRTRLRTAPWAAVSLALLVLVTSYLAAALPRVVDAYETEGLRHEIATAPPHRTVLDLTVPLRINEPRSNLTPAVLGTKRDRLRALFPEPLRTDPEQTVHGIRTVTRVQGLDRWLPRPDGISPEFVLSSPSDLTAHATVRQGRLPAGTADAPEAAVTAATAKSLNIRPGSVVHVPGKFSSEPLAVTVTGIVEPRGPESAYWAVEPLLRTPALAPLVGDEVKYYWQAALLLSPVSAPILPATTGEPELFWRFMPTSDHLTARDVDRLATALDSVGTGADLADMRQVMGINGAAATELDALVGDFRSMRQAIDPVVAVAVFGIGAVAAVVLAMTGGLFAARRDSELSLLRSRGASLTGIGLRLLGETSAVTIPAAALGLLLAVVTVRPPEAAGGGPGSGLPLTSSVLAAACVALLAMLVLPLRAVVLHRRPRLHGGRDDLLDARPSRRRTVAELTLLVLAVGAVASLRLRGGSAAPDGSGSGPGQGGAGSGAAGGGGSADLLLSAAPVLVGMIAALVLVRLYPLPLRWLARPARRLRGAVGPLALARAGRSSSTGALPLLALVLALATAAFGGSVLGGVAEARDRAALLATGADARIEGSVEFTPVPEGLTEAVRGTAGVRDVAAVQIEYGVSLPSHQGTTAPAMSTPLVGVEPDSYTRLAARTGFGPFPAALLASTGRGGEDAVADTARVLPAVASPSVADRLGTEPLEIISAAGVFRVKVVAVRSTTPALTGADFLLVNIADLTHPQPTALLVTGTAAKGPALRAAVTGKAVKPDDFAVTLRGELRSTYVDSPLQSGAERIYAAAIGAGAGFAAVAVLLSLMQSAPERTKLLARLRTMGLTRKQGRRLLGLEALPQAVLAALGGMLAGWATVPLLAPGIDLFRLALATTPGLSALDSAPLRADPWSLALPALGVVLLTGAAALGQAWWAVRRGSIQELRAGDAR